MSTVSNLANASNETRLQNIMRLRRAFNEEKVMSVAAAMRYFAVTRITIIRWCKAGNIPLMDEKSNDSVVPLTDLNRPSWW